MNLNRLYVLVIAVLVFVLYARVVTHEHVLDDFVLIPNQPALQAPFDVEQILLGRYWEGVRTQDTLYRPMTIWTLSMNYWANTLMGLPGDHPVIYRVTSMLLHASVSVLVFVFVRWLGFTPNVGLWAGLLFAVLPIHTEAVAAAVNRSEILALGFGLCFLMVFQTRWLWACLFLFLALLSKESALLFLPVAGWYALTVRKDSERFLFWPMISYGVVVVLWWLMRSVVIGNTLQAVVMIDNPLVMASVGERILTALAVQWQYVFLQVIPIGLSSDYSFNQIPLVQSIWTLDVWLFVGTVILGGWWAWRVRHIHSVVPFLFGTYVLLIGLTSNVLFPVGTVMGERLVYAPSICLCVLGGWGITRVPRDWMWWVGGILVVIYGGVTVTRLGVWENAQTFYTAQVALAPQSAKAHYAVAHEVYQPAGEWDRAVEHYKRAIEILPNYPDAWNNLGVIKKDRGDLLGALAAYKTALKWHRSHVAARVNMGQAFQNLGEDGKAMATYAIALERDTTHAIAGNNLAILYAQHGKADSAQMIFERVLRHHPDYVSAQKNYQMFLEAIRAP